MPAPSWSCRSGPTLSLHDALPICEPRGRHWVGQVAGHRRSIAGKDEPLISAVLLVVIEPQARLDADAVADLPTELAEQREAGVIQILGVDSGMPIEHRW